MSFDRSKLFSTKTTQERSVTACGETFTVHVRRLPAVDLRRFYAQVSADQIDTRAEAGFEALSKSIRNENGDAFATVEEYRRMDTEALTALMAVFTEINATRKDEDLGNV